MILKNSSESHRLVERTADDHRAHNKPLAVSEMVEMVQQKSSKIKIKRNYRAIKPVSVPTAKKIIAASDVQFADGMPRTDARFDACKCMFNCISYLAALYIIKTLHIDQHFVFNLDATQFEVSSTNILKSKKGVFVVPADYEGKVPYREKGLGETLYVKWMPFICLDGSWLKKIVLIVADPESAEGTCQWHKISGLTTTNSDYDNDGYIIFQKSRALSTVFFVKYYKEVLMHHIVQKKTLHKYDGWSIMYLDGEFYQCESFIRDEELDRLLREHKVLIVKLPASTSSICQALDAGKIFLTTKKILHYLENFWHQRLLYQHI